MWKPDMGAEEAKHKSRFGHPIRGCLTLVAAVAIIVALLYVVRLFI